MIALAALAAVFLAFWTAALVLLPRVERTVRSGAGRLARWLRAHARFGPVFGRIEPWRAYLPLVLAFATGTVVIVVTAHAFVDLAVALRAGSPVVRGVDRAVYDWVAARRTAFATWVFVAITTAGGAGGMAVLVTGVLAVLLFRRRFRWAAYLALTAGGGVLLNQLLKVHFERQRPDLKAAVLAAAGYSFPSGHSMSGVIVPGALAYLAARSMRTWAGKSAVFAALSTYALSIGISRVYLGVHWASDVGAGFVAGLLWLTATTTGYELFRQYRRAQAGRAKLGAGAPPRP